MATKKYGSKASEKVEKAMHEMKRGKLKSGRSGRKVTDPKQAVAIGLSEARAEGGKVPDAPAKKAKSSAPKKRASSKTRASTPRSGAKSASRSRSTSSTKARKNGASAKRTTSPKKRTTAKKRTSTKRRAT